MVTLFAQFFDKRDTFDFDIVNFSELSGNIPTAPAYGTYTSQLIRYSRACHNYDNFSSRHSMLAERRFNQGFSARKPMRTFYKFMGRYPELASKLTRYRPSVDEVVIGAGCCAQDRACLLLRAPDAIID